MYSVQAGTCLSCKLTQTCFLQAQVDEGLRSLDMAMNCGFEDYAKVRSDKNLANLRSSPKFEPLLEKYDEPGEPLSLHCDHMSDFEASEFAS
jgi:hypothetical protein